MRYLHAPALTAARPIALFIALLGALLSPSAADTGDGRTIKNYVHVSWTLADGAPPDIWALVQAPDGYMWLGTGAGLYRFDGIRFERVRPMAGDAFPSTDILSLFAAPTGEIWIGYQNGGISVLKSGRLTNFSQGHLSQSVNEIVLGADNAIWVATDSGLARHADGRWQDIDGDWGMPAGVVQTLRVGHDGTLWAVVRHSIAADSGSELKFLRPGSRRFETSTDPQSTSWFGTTFVTQVQEDAGGRFWASGQDTSVAVLPTSQVRARPAPALQSPGAPLPIRSKYILLDRDGNVWGRHPLGGIFRDRIQIQDPGMLTLGAGHFADRFSSKDGLTSDIDRSFLEDREGNVWVGTNLGLDLFRPANIVAQAGIPVTAPFGYRVAAGDDGTVYIEDSQTLFRIRSGGAAQVVYRSPSRIGFLHVTGDGSVWLAVKGKLLRLTKTGMTSIALPADIRSELLQTCAIDRSGVLWVSVWDKGIFRLDKTVWTRFTVAPELAHIGPLMMQFDAQGRLWLHYLHRPLVLVDGNEVRNFSEKDGPDIGEIETIYAGARDVLFAGDQGLARFDGHRFQTLHSTDLPVLNRVAGIVETARGETWLNTIAGILRIQTKDLNRAFDHPEYRLRYQTLDFRDGLPGLAQEDSYEPTAIEATDGRLWFITNHGIAWIDPAHLVRNPLPPPVAIRSLTVDGTEYPFPKTLELAEGVSNLRIDYEALSLSIPERVRFRYRLDGVDKGWIDPGDRRQAFYTELAPGDYRFQVIAANNDGVWNATGATLRFDIPPSFIQSRWFFLLCALAGLAVLWLLYTLRLRQVAARIRDRLEERLRERERIARELHDTLLQGFQGLVLRFQSVADRIPPGEPTRKLIDDVLDRADQVIIEGRDRVRDLRPSADDDDLSLVIATTVDHLMPDASLSIRVISEGAPRRIHAVVRDEISKIVREAVFNVIRHAQAKSVEIGIVYKRRELSVYVRDDGKGIDPDTLKRGGREGHYGLTGMRERAQGIRAEFILSSRPGAGTEIELTVPANAAYTDHWSPRHLWQRFSTVES